MKSGMDLQSEHERYLTDKHVKRPVIVMNYPKDIKAFYMRVNDDGRTVAAMDGLHLELAKSLAAASARSGSTCWIIAWTDRGIDKEHYAWYRDLRRYGTVPHAGVWAPDSSAPSLTSLASPTCAMLSRFHERQETRICYDP